MSNAVCDCLCVLVTTKYILILVPGALGRSALLVWGDYVRRPHHRRLGSQVVQDLPGRVHGIGDGTLTEQACFILSQSYEFTA